MKYPEIKNIGLLLLLMLIGFGLFAAGIIEDSWIKLVAGMFWLISIQPFSIIHYQGTE